MAFTQSSDSKTLGRLRGPELSSIRRVDDETLPVYALDRVGDRRRSNHCITATNHCSATVKQTWVDQTASTVMDQDVLCIVGKCSQTSLHRFLARAATFNPGNRLGRCMKKGCDLVLVSRLADHPDPVDDLSSESRLQSPGEQRPAPKIEQEFVAISSHTPAASRCRNQQMHKRLLLAAV